MPLIFNDVHFYRNAFAFFALLHEFYDNRKCFAAYLNLIIRAERLLLEVDKTHESFSILVAYIKKSFACNSFRKIYFYFHERKAKWLHHRTR